MRPHLPVVPEIAERPAGYIPPNLSPRGLELRPRQLGDGVYALLANQVPKDNNGLIVGDRAALVVDAGVTPAIGRHIQQVAAELTDRPVRYVANTTFHGDHMFGNAAFDDAVTVGYARTLRALRATLDVATVVPGHGFVADASRPSAGCSPTSNAWSTPRRSTCARARPSTLWSTGSRSAIRWSRLRGHPTPTGSSH